MSDPTANPQAKRTELSEYGEFGLIEHLTKNFELQHALTLKGIGDDAAVIDSAGKLTVVSTDLLVEGIHFDLSYVPLKHLGYKSVVVNLSDIYAMHADPRQITVSIAVSNRFSVEALEELYDGIHAACKRYKVDLIGGDTTTSGKGLVISITAIGEAIEEELVYRDGAKEGDLICVSGNLGGAYLGLQILEREKQLWIDNPQIKPDLENKQYIIGRQLKPEARFDIIEDLRKFEVKPTSMIDVSDGLSSDLLHICHSSNVGALIEEEQVPIHEESYNMALKFSIDPINTALNGGEDYELLFTVPADKKEVMRGMLDVAIIGVITEASKGVKLHTKGNNTHELVAGGWNHLRPQNTLRD